LAALLVLSGMLVMAWNTWKTFQEAKSTAPQPILPADPSAARGLRHEQPNS
jgi:cytochrome c oxidase cbb3-type subunit 1